MPVSCEVLANSTLTSSEKMFYDVGCIDMAASYLSEHVVIVIIVSSAIMVFQVCVKSILKLSQQDCLDNGSVSVLLSGQICSGGALGGILSKISKDLPICNVDSLTFQQYSAHHMYHGILTNIL